MDPIANTSPAQARYKQASEAELRVLTLVDLATCCATEAFERSLPDNVDALLEDLADGAMLLHPSMSELATVIRERLDADAQRDLGEHLFPRFMGLALKVATPTCVPIGSGSWTANWGYYHTSWVYADTYELAWQYATEWAKSSKEHDLAGEAAAASHPRPS